jgi:hypothetical protein
MTTDRLKARPNLELARDITRNTGPTAMVAGGVITAAGLMLMSSPSGLYVPAAYGLLVTLFGLASWARTESVPGRIAQWLVTLVFAAGSAIALLKWAVILWGTEHRNYTDGGDPAMVAILLTAGPALLVPGLIAAIRPVWTPLIAFPALVSIAFAATFGYGAIIPLGMPDGTPLEAHEPWALGVISLASIWVLVAALRAALAALRRHDA